ncbi:MAG: alpha-galactosidase [Victivallales bacterium]|nr:alpha-galactosidase [Victivallales bacterium]
MEKYKDCYASWTENTIVIGNQLIERRFQWCAQGLVCTATVDKASAKEWQGEEPPAVTTDVTIECAVSENDGLSAKHLLLTATERQGGGVIETKLGVYPMLPFIILERRCKGLKPSAAKRVEETGGTGNENAVAKNVVEAATLDRIDNVPLNVRHLKLKAIKLFDRTDLNDCLATEEKFHLYPGCSFSARGNVFLFDNYVKGNGLLVVKDSPTHLYQLLENDDSLRVRGTRNADIVGAGLHGDIDAGEWCQLYGTTVGVGDSDKLLSEYRKLYAAQYIASGFKEPFIMSNTWGDRSQDSRVCEEFMLKEIEAGAKLGVDIIQIDDGWQKGVTINSKVKKSDIWEGYYAADPDFWTVNPMRFPNGLKPLVKKAAEHGIRFGLWFAPDSSHEFANWRRDVETVLNLHRMYGISSFKLDSVNLLSKKAETNYLNFLTVVERESRNRIALNLDCTAQNRQGYVMWKQFGTLFVENRYTDWCNYFPHNTLKNLWMLSQFIPPRKFQFELLNNSRNDEKYGDDPLRPAMYDITYEFASVMVANPLVWMEMSNLTDKLIASLQKLISVYRDVRKDFFDAEIYPIGEQPDGCSHTGFQIVVDGKKGYLLLFKEIDAIAKHVYRLPAPLSKKTCITLLATNAAKSAPKLSLVDDVMVGLALWECKRDRTFALYQYES